VQVLCGAGSKRKIRGLEVAPVTLGIKAVQPLLHEHCKVMKDRVVEGVPVNRTVVTTRDKTEGQDLRLFPTATASENVIQQHCGSRKICRPEHCRQNFQCACFAETVSRPPTLSRLSIPPTHALPGAASTAGDATPTSGPSGFTSAGTHVANLAGSFAALGVAHPKTPPRPCPGFTVGLPNVLVNYAFGAHKIKSLRWVIVDGNSAKNQITLQALTCGNLGPWGGGTCNSCLVVCKSAAFAGFMRRTQHASVHIPLDYLTLTQLKEKCCESHRRETRLYMCVSVLRLPILSSC
jgi:hypothetical protein